MGCKFKPSRGFWTWLTGQLPTATLSPPVVAAAGALSLECRVYGEFVLGF